MSLPTTKIYDLLDQMKLELHGLYKGKEIRSFWFILLEEYCSLDKARVLADKNIDISESAMLKVQSAINELKRFRPVQYITGKASFCDMDFKVTPDVMIPRPETEELVKWILSDYKGSENKILKILDIGTGSGCIAIALAKGLPFSQVQAIDDSLEAISVATKNAIMQKCVISCEFSDILFESSWDTFVQFDVIVSNPPHFRLSEMKTMKLNVLQYEPESALFVTDEDPLVFYRTLLRFASLKLAPGGSLYFEINEALSGDTKKLALDNGFIDTIIHKDLSGKDRMLRCRKRSLNSGKCRGD